MKDREILLLIDKQIPGLTISEHDEYGYVWSFSGVTSQKSFSTVIEAFINCTATIVRSLEIAVNSLDEEEE